MKYYSEKIFKFLITIYAYAGILVLIYWLISVYLACWGVTSSIGCKQIKMEQNIFNGLLPFLFILLSVLIIILQQKINKHFGYLIAPLLIISPFFYKYVISTTTWFDIGWFLSVVNTTGQSMFYKIFFLICILALLIISLIPFYVLIKLVRYDILKK